MTPHDQPVVTRYGEHESQFFEVSTPIVAPLAGAVVLLHGGWWRQGLSLRLMDDLAADLVARGHLVCNLEYRRIDVPGADGGWPTTLLDVTTGIEAFLDAHSLDSGTVVAVGHSAGGHLALLSAKQLGLAGAVAQAPITDLQRCAAGGLGEGATPIFMGGQPEDMPGEYNQASPVHQVPIGCPQLVVHGTADGRVPIEHSRKFVSRARSAGDEVRLLEVIDGDHMFVLDPAHAYWAQTSAWIQAHTEQALRSQTSNTN